MRILFREAQFTTTGTYFLTCIHAIYTLCFGSNTQSCDAPLVIEQCQSAICRVGSACVETYAVSVQPARRRMPCQFSLCGDVCRVSSPCVETYAVSVQPACRRMPCQFTLRVDVCRVCSASVEMYAVSVQHVWRCTLSWHVGIIDCSGELISLLEVNTWLPSVPTCVKRTVNALSSVHCCDPVQCVIELFRKQ